MPELCQNCGAELYGGQQFCRRCGTPVSAKAAGAEAPTQILPDGTQPAQAPEAAASRVGVATGPVGAQQPTAYYPRESFQQTSPLVGQPFGSRPLAVEPPPPAPRRRRRGVWLFALLAVFVLGVGLASGAAFIWWRATRQPIIIKKINTPGGVPEVPPIPEVPEIPADLGDRIKEALKTAGVPLPIDESDAVVAGDTTTLTRTYEVDGDSAFAVRVVKGNVSVTGTDGDSVVVKVVKKGGSAAERTAARVLESKTDEGLTLMTTPGASAVSVSYEVSVPRGLRQLEISAEKGDVNVREFDGTAVLNLTNGNISVASTGAVRSRLTNGKTSVSYIGHHQEPQEFTVVNGDVEVIFGSEPEVDVKAAATNGEVKVDDMFGVKAERRTPGSRLDTQFGGGGAPLTLKVVNGDIRLKP